MDLEQILARLEALGVDLSGRRTTIRSGEMLRRTG